MWNFLPTHSGVLNSSLLFINLYNNCALDSAVYKELLSTIIFLLTYYWLCRPLFVILLFQYNQDQFLYYSHCVVLWNGSFRCSPLHFVSDLYAIYFELLGARMRMVILRQATLNCMSDFEV